MGWAAPPEVQKLHADLLLKVRDALLPHMAGGCDAGGLLAMLGALAGPPAAAGGSPIFLLPSENVDCGVAPSTPQPGVHGPAPCTPPKVEPAALSAECFRQDEVTVPPKVEPAAMSAGCFRQDEVTALAVDKGCRQDGMMDDFLDTNKEAAEAIGWLLSVVQEVAGELKLDEPAVIEVVAQKSECPPHKCAIQVFDGRASLVKGPYQSSGGLAFGELSESSYELYTQLSPGDILRLCSSGSIDFGAEEPCYDSAVLSIFGDGTLVQQVLREYFDMVDNQEDEEEAAAAALELAVLAVGLDVVPLSEIGVLRRHMALGICSARAAARGVCTVLG